MTSGMATSLDLFSTQEDVYRYRDVEVAGTLSAGAGVLRYRFPKAATVLGISATVNTAPTGAAILIDVNKNGTTLFTTQGNRPSIAINAFATSAEVTNMNVTSFAAGDYLTVDVDQVGSTVAGANLVVTIRYI